MQHLAAGSIIGGLTGGLIAAFIVFVINDAWRYTEFLRTAAIVNVVLPGFGAALGALLGAGVKLRQIASTVSDFLRSRGLIDRAWIAWSVVWTSGLGIAIAAAGPFWRRGYSWEFERDIVATWLWWLVPIFGSYVIAKLVSWVMSGQR